MRVITRIGGILLLALATTLFAQQSTDYIIVKIPTATVKSDTLVEVQWAGSSRNPLDFSLEAPDSGYIYYSKAPGGGKLANYKNRVTVPWTDTTVSPRITLDNLHIPAGSDPVARRSTVFKPNQQTDMRAGVFYCIVALPLAADTLVSNEFQIIVESPDLVKRTAPTGTITDLTPTFQWEPNPGVPYYHVLLSDEPINFDNSTGEIDLKGLSIIWQAITPTNQIVYGAPDPSQTITADPPPLSPGTRYTWVVLNNYGNHPAFSSSGSAELPPGLFTMGGQELRRPVNVFPASSDSLNATENGTFSFRFSNLDPGANTYKIYVYVAAELSGFEGVEAKMTVWQKEVRAAADAEEMAVEIDASSILTSNRYFWRVMAIDERGAASAGDTSSFRYSAPVGTMNIYTREKVVVAAGGRIDTVVNAVGLSQAKMEVLDGSMEAPILFYTDQSGNLSRQRPAGSYRVTMVKDGFEDQTRTITLADGAKTQDTFYLERPESQVYGRVVDESNQGINLAAVTAVSDRGDTVTTKCDGKGGFALNCYGADWRIGFGKTGYKTVLPRKITVGAGESYDFKTVTLERNPFTLSGVVKNANGQPLVGVNVKLFRGGTELSSVPSTPQTGAFSFTVPAGTYKLTADKVGFTSHSNTVEVVNTRTVSVTLQPRAALVTGFVQGKSFVNGKAAIAPITNAKILFVKVGGADTLAANIDPVYGNYNISLPGSQEYSVLISADGFSAKETPGTVSTGTSANIFYSDTLQAYATIPGMVRMSSSKAVAGDVGISLVDIATGKVGASAKSTASGYFELRGIVDGSYLITAGRDGIVLDSILGPDTIIVSGGLPTPVSTSLFMKAGDKTIRWTVLGADSGSIKVQSPIQKTLSFSDTLAEAGAGTYIVVVDAAPDSVIDLSYHKFVVPEDATEYRDWPVSDVIRSMDDTLAPVNGMVTVSLWSAAPLDSAVLFFKDANAAGWSSTSNTAAASRFTFTIEPPNDGSVMQYYFKAYRGSDVYGYDRETYFAYVRPDASTLTKVEVVPSSDDTLTFAAGSEVSFSLRGYYSSSFLPAAMIDSTGVSWSLADEQGCSLVKAAGLSTTLKTAGETARLVTLTATIDPEKIPLKTGVANTIVTGFHVTSTSLARIDVRRVDDKAPYPISTSVADRAEFVARGYAEDSTEVDVTPVWTINPPDAGTIVDGAFRPRGKFIGYVRVIATAGDLRGEYAAPDGQAGLQVMYILARKDVADTASNGRGFRLVFPPNAVPEDEHALIELSVPRTTNQLSKGFANFRLVGDESYDITEREGIVFDLSQDSINLVLDIPENRVADAASGKKPFQMARWNDENLMWDTLSNSVLAADGRYVSAKLAHFSRYGIVSKPPPFSLDVSVAPNPFSPMVKAQPASGLAMFGTRIRVSLTDPQANVYSIDTRIYNMVGERVWGMEIRNARAGGGAYDIWWDGTTTDRIRVWEQAANDRTVTVPGKRLCRNGRYFVVVTVTDFKNKKHKVMKQIILMK